MTRIRKRYAQNLIRNHQLARLIVAKSGIGPTDTVCEIGAGAGILTRELARRARSVIAIEIDPAMAARLRRRLSANERNVRIICADVLRHGIPLSCDKVLGNIPFNRSAAIVRRILASPQVETSTLVLQREAAAKYSGQPRESEMSLLHKPIFRFEHLHQFRRRDFIPPTGVNTVLLRIERRDPPFYATGELEMFRNLVSFGFRSTQPSLRRTFRSVFSRRQWTRLACDLNFSAQTGPSGLSFEQWQGLYAQFRSLVPPFRQSKVF